MQYWTQEKAPSGNFVDSLGTNNLQTAKDFADYLITQNQVARVVERQDTVVYEPLTS